METAYVHGEVETGAQLGKLWLLDTVKVILVSEADDAGIIAVQTAAFEVEPNCEIVCKPEGRLVEIHIINFNDATVNGVCLISSYQKFHNLFKMEPCISKMDVEIVYKAVLATQTISTVLIKSSSSSSS